MKTKVLRSATALGIALGVVCSTSGCTENETSIFIRQVVAPSTSDCSYSSDPSSTAVLSGVLDLAFASEYKAGLLIGNQLSPRGSTELGRVETSRVALEGTEVRIRSASGALIREYTYPGGGFADPGSGGEPGWGVVSTILVDSQTSSELNRVYPQGQRSSLVQRVVVGVRVFGHTVGGQEVKSEEFSFPINVCYGCLVSFPADANDPSQSPQPNCLATESSSGSSSNQDLPCNYGQDSLIDCRVCRSQGGGALCEVP